MIEILFMGRKPVAAAVLSKIYEDPRCKVIGVLTDSHLADSVTTERAEQLGVPVLDYHDVMQAVHSGDFKFDLALSVLYWRKLSRPLIEASKHGVINFHPAPLPDYKGVGGYNLAILHGLRQWAVSAHYVDEEIDTGEIIRVDPFAINLERETAQSLERKSVTALEHLIDAVMEDFLSEPRKLASSPNIGGVYLSRPEMEDLKRIDPENDDVDRKVRAFWFPPYSGAYIEIGGRQYTLVNDVILQELGPAGISSLFSKPAKN